MEALRGLTLAVPKGSIYGFLGRNGAGKTTTIKVLLGMARPSGGDATGVRPYGTRRTGQRRDPPPHRVRQRRQGALSLLQRKDHKGHKDHKGILFSDL